MAVVIEQVKVIEGLNLFDSAVQFPKLMLFSLEKILMAD